MHSIKTGQEEDTGKYSDESKRKDHLLRRTWLCMVDEDEQHGGIN